MIIEDPKRKGQSQDGQAGQPEPTPVPAPVQAQPAPPVEVAKSAPVDATQALVNMMLKREARAAAKEQAELDAIEAKNRQRDINARSNFNDELEKQVKCKHLKGGKNRIRTQAKDFAVYMHTFINKEVIIRCFLCGMKWKTLDTKEHLVRNGISLPNHTKIGWEEAVNMINETSNQPSASEIPMNATAVVSGIEVQ